MKSLFAIVFLLHTLLHLLGVLGSFWPEMIPQIHGKISPTEGAFWLLAFTSFLVGSISYLSKKDWWPAPAIVGVILSQFLLFLNWHDAQFGTFANLLILIVALSSYARSRFDQMVQKETFSISSEKPPAPLQSFNCLPPIVQKWLTTSGALNYPMANTVRVEQKGKLKTSKKGLWMPFIAVQLFNAGIPAFVWKAEVTPFPPFFLLGRDKLQSGKGELLIKLLGLVTVAHAVDDIKVNSATLQRYLGEICWFPSAALRPYLSWMQLSDSSAKAILVQDGTAVEGTYKFSTEGRLLSFEAFRFYGADKYAKKEKWLIEMLDYAPFNGISVPSRCKVTWQLPDGDFHWLTLTVTSIKYDPRS